MVRMGSKTVETSESERRMGRRDTWRHASNWGRPNRGPASRVTQGPVTRWEEKIQDSEAELGDSETGDGRVMAESVGQSVAKR